MKPRGRPVDKQRCSVIDCQSTRRDKSHQFPKNKNLGERWVEVTGNPDLLDLTYQLIHDKKYCICWKHFTEEDYYCGIRRRLKGGVVPTLLLPKRKENFSSRERNDSKIDLEEKENFSAEINVTPPRTEFSPINYESWTPRQSRNIAF